MRSPADMGTIQIDITNACNMKCSNCTRFCGNHDNVFFMNYDTFKRAVESLEGFDGITGVIGGEPTLHPEFERFAGLLREKFGAPVGEEGLLYPQKDFIHGVHQREFASEVIREYPSGGKFMKKYGAGLWSNMSNTYQKHYETIQDTFSVQYLNDHLNPSFHQPGLFSRKDLGIPDEEWFKLRDKCWIQNTWSATITPKGAFFCEVAGALDMLFDGPGGWPIEPGWWKRTHEDFKDQLHWCDICGFELEGRTFTRDSQEETDDVSPTVYEMLKKTESPKLKSGHINPVRIENGIIDMASKPEDKRFVVGDRYIAKYEDRFQEKNSVLFHMDIEEVMISDGDGFGEKLNKLIFAGGVAGQKNINSKWILLKEQEDVDCSELKEMIGKRVFNPGCLHVGDKYVFFCVNANSLKGIGYDRIRVMNSINELIASWQKKKVIKISDTEEKTSLIRETIKKDKRSAIWGAGMLGEMFAEIVNSSGGKVVKVVDKATDKQGIPFANVQISSPNVLIKEKNGYDYLIIAHHLCFEEIEEEAISLGVPKEKIVLPYEI